MAYASSLNNVAKAIRPHVRIQANSSDDIIRQAVTGYIPARLRYPLDH